MVMPAALAAGIALPTAVAAQRTDSAAVLEDIVVTAARREQRLKDVVVPTEVITRAMIEATGAADVASVLMEQTGIQFQGGHPSGESVMLQGLSAERVLVLLDGQPLYGRISGTFDLARIPTSIVQRIEVVKGPQSALYGSEAMGGVVNIVTRAPTNRWTGELRATGGSNGRFETGGTGNAAFGRVAVRADLGRRAMHRAPGRVAAAGALSERLDGAMRWSWQPRDRVQVGASVLMLDERQRWPSGIFNEFADNTQVSAQANAAFVLGAHLVRPAVHVSYFDHLSRRSDALQPYAGSGDRQTQQLIESEVSYSGALGGAVLDGGIEVKHERITSSDGRIAGAPTTVSVEPFAQMEWSTGRWSFVPGARLTWNERWGTVATPRLALRYRAGDDLALRLAVGRGFRAPDFKELHLQFINDGAGYTVYGNSDLRPEHSSNVTAGVEWTQGRWYARAGGFWNDLTNFIETRAVPDGGPLIRYSYANVSHGRTWGTEFEGGVTLSPVQLEAGYAWLGTEDGETGQPLLGRPVHSGRLTANYGWRRGARASVTGVYTGATPMQREESGAVVSERDAFVRVDARVAYPVPAGLELMLGVDNVFNALPDAWSDAVGRQWYTGIRWHTNAFSD